MIQIGYRCCEYNCCVYVKCLDDGLFIFLLLYVDDMLIAVKSWYDVIELKVLLGKEFNMKELGTAKKIFGMEYIGIEAQENYGYLSKAMLRKC